MKSLPMLMLTIAHSFITKLVEFLSDSISMKHTNHHRWQNELKRQKVNLKIVFHTTNSTRIPFRNFNIHMRIIIGLKHFFFVFFLLLYYLDFNAYGLWLNFCGVFRSVLFRVGILNKKMEIRYCFRLRTLYVHTNLTHIRIARYSL